MNILNQKKTVSGNIFCTVFLLKLCRRSLMVKQ